MIHAAKSFGVEGFQSAVPRARPPHNYTVAAGRKRFYLCNPHFAIAFGRGTNLLSLSAPMRYIRFLKTPRVVTEKGTSKSQISCLITVTSDLGDSFLPHNLELSAELLSSQPTEEIKVWRTVQWAAGMRSLLVTFPLAKILSSTKLRIRVGVEPKSIHDAFDKLSEEGTCGVVSAWSPEFYPFATTGGTEKLVERRFDLSGGHIISIYEETGESIARHLW
jgi:hypothetical protein